MGWRDTAMAASPADSKPAIDTSTDVPEPTMQHVEDLEQVGENARKDRKPKSWRDTAIQVSPFKPYISSAQDSSQEAPEVDHSNPDLMKQEHEQAAFARANNISINQAAQQPGANLTIDQLKDDYVAPVGEWLQKNVGHPIAKAVGHTVFPMAPGERAIDHPPNPVEGLAQAATTLIHGQDVKSQEMRSAIGCLVGPGNVDTALDGAHFFGDSVGWLALPGGLELEAEEKAPVLEKLGKAFFNGASNGAYGQFVQNLFTKGKPLTEDVGSSALKQGALFGLVRAGAETGKKLIGILPSKSVTDLGQELSSLFGDRAEKGKSPGIDESLLDKQLENEENLKAAGSQNEPRIKNTGETTPGSPQKIKANKPNDLPKNFEPFMGVASKDEFGRPQVDLHEVTFKDGVAKPKIVRLPVHDDLDAIKLKQFLKDKDIPITKGSDTFDEMGPMWNKNVFGENMTSPDVPYETFADDKNKLRVNALDSTTPDNVIKPGDTVDVHKPGEGLSQAEVTKVEGGKIKTVDGQVLNHTQAVPAHQLPESEAQGNERGAGHTVQPHEQVTPPPLPVHRAPAPGELPSSHLDNFSQGANYMKSDLSGSLYKNWLQPSLSLNLPVNAQATALAIHGEPTFNELKAMHMKALLAGTGKTNPSLEFGTALEAHALADTPAKQSQTLKKLESFPEWASGKDLFNRYLLSRTLKSNEIDNYLMRAGFGPMQKEGEGLGDQYMTRLFMAHDPNIPWEKQARAMDLVEPAIKELAAKDPNMPEHVIRSWVDNALQGKSTWDGLSAQMQTSGSKAFKNLKSRQDLGPATRAMLGEVHDGITRLAYSHAAQDGILAHLKNMEALSQDIEVFSKNEVPGWEKLPGTKQWGASAGGYVRPDVYEAIKINPMTKPVDGWVRKATGIMKEWQTNPILAGLGALTNHVHNSELLGMMGSRSANPVAITRDIVTAQRALLSYSKDPLGTGDGEIAKLAKDLGVLKSYSSLNDLKSNSERIMENYISGMEKHAFSETPMDIEDWKNHTTKTAYKLGAKTIGGINDAGKAFYDHTIQSIRLSNFIGARNELLKRDADGLYSTLARELSQTGMTVMPEKFSQWARSDVENMANRLAARRVTLSTANPQTMAPIARKVSQATGNVGVSFTTPLAETSRILAQMPSRFKDDANYRYRIAGWTTLMGGFLAARKAVQVLHGGMSSDAMDEAYKNAPDSWKASHPFAKYMPSMYANTFRDAKGRITFGDSVLPVTQTIEELFRAANPKDAGTPAALVQNAADHFWPGKGNDLQDVMSRMGATQPTPQFKPRPGEGAMMSLVNDIATLANHAMVPRSLNNFAQAAKGMGWTRETQPNQEQLTPMQGVGRAMGITKPVPVGEASALARQGEQRGRESEAKRAIFRRNQTPEERQGAQKNYQDVLSERNK